MKLPDLRIGWYIGDLAFTMHDDADFGSQINGEADMGLEIAQGTQGLNFQRVAVELQVIFFVDSINDHLGGNGAIQLARFTGAAAKSDKGAFKNFGNAGHFLVQRGAAGSGLGANVFHLAQSAGGSEDSQTLRKQEVAAIAIGDFLGVTGAAKLVDIFEQ